MSSYFFALESQTAATVNTSVTFNTPVLGIIYLDDSPFYATSNFLGAFGTTYLTGSGSSKSYESAADNC